MRKSIKALLFIGLLSLTKGLFADVAELDNASLQALIDQGVPVVDIRRKDEWQQTGIVEGSHLLTFFDEKGRYDVAAWLSELQEIAPAGEPVILVCAHGVRSANVAKLLDRKLGYSQVHNVTRGIAEWIGKDQPVVPHQQP